MRRIYLACFAVIYLLMCDDLIAESPKLVGELGIPERVLFRGNLTFTQKQIRDAMGTDLDSLLAGHPESELSEFLVVICNRVKAGYQNTGFPEPVINASYDESESAVIVSIVEGNRYLMGTVVIQDAVTIPVDRVRDFLTRPQSKKVDPNVIPVIQNPPEKTAAGISFKVTQNKNNESKKDDSNYSIWGVGDPVPFSDFYKNEVETTLSKIFEKLGYFDVIFKVAIQKQNDGTATLLIKIHDEGPVPDLSEPVSVLGEIQIEGNKKNTDEEIIKFLGLIDGTPLNSDVISEIKNKLRESARFLTRDVEIITSPFGNNSAILRIRVCESEYAPRLDEEFSEIQKLVLRTGQWYESLATSKEDISFEISSPPSGPKETLTQDAKEIFGVKVKIVFSPVDESLFVAISLVNPSGNLVFDGVFFADRGQLTYDVPSIKARFELPHFKMHTLATVSITGSSPDKNGGSVKMTLGFTQRSSHDGTSSTKTEFSIDPVAMIESHGKSKGTARLDENRFVFTEDYLEWIYDSKSGRLIDLRMIKETGHSGKIRVATGLYKENFDEYLKGTADFKVVRFDDVDFAPNPFQIPLNRELSKGLTKDVFSTLLPVSRLVLPDPSWAWTFVREFALANTGHSLYSRKVIQSIMVSPKTGPVAHLAGSYLFGLTDPALKAEFARQGLKKLETSNFRNDYQPFLEGDTLARRAIHVIAQVLKECPEDDLRSLVNSMIPDEGPVRDVVSQSVREFSRQSELTTNEAITKLLDQLWVPFIRPQVEKLLVELSQSKPPVIRVTGAVPDESTFKSQVDFDKILK